SASGRSVRYRERCQAGRIAERTALKGSGNRNVFLRTKTRSYAQDAEIFSLSSSGGEGWGEEAVPGAPEWRFIDKRKAGNYPCGCTRISTKSTKGLDGLEIGR